MKIHSRIASHLKSTPKLSVICGYIVGSIVMSVSQPALAQQRVTVSQLEEVISSLQGKHGKDAAHRLSSLELVERLSGERYELLKKQLPDGASQQSLMLLADESAFLAPPVDEIPGNPIPEIADQSKMLILVSRYVENMMRQMPNLTATRSTLSFQSPPGKQSKSEPLHFNGRAQRPVFYLGGREIDGRKEYGDSKPNASVQKLDTLGEFGPILKMVMGDTAHSGLVWKRWEQSGHQLLAVFQYEIPLVKSHYQISYCCAPSNDPKAMTPYKLVPSYYGEISIDPSNGTVFRITVETKHIENSPLWKTGTLVEYGPVKIDGNTYICPLKSVSTSRASSIPTMDANGISQMTADNVPNQTLLQDIVFDGFRRFGTESHIVIEDKDSLPTTNPANLPLGDSGLSPKP